MYGAPGLPGLIAADLAIPAVTPGTEQSSSQQKMEAAVIARSQKKEKTAIQSPVKVGCSYISLL